MPPPDDDDGAFPDEDIAAPPAPLLETRARNADVERVPRSLRIE
jgi:hypothetical protein|tara:strand:- start:442 stop:573 length:132 start_codon:yes stop_codon:yes gene_type:complete